MHWTLRLTAFLVSVASISPLAAHNGAVAVAVPTSSIVVDGDLSDWSPGASAAPIAASNQWSAPAPTSGFRSIAHTPQRLQHVEYGASPVDAADFSATLQIAYDSEHQILYVAIKTSDQSVWIDTTAQSTWNNQDGCDIYLALHDTAATMVRQYSIYGDELALGSGTDVEYAVALTDSGSSYEWSLDLAKVFGAELQSGSNIALGFDISVSDYDADGSYSWFSWGPGIRKFQRSDRLGDLLLSRSESVGTSRGRVIWSADGQPAAGRRLRLRSQSAPPFWVDAITDDAGRWLVQLPKGRYRIDEASVAGSGAMSIDVGYGLGTERTVALSEVRGHSLGAITGRIIPAGSGDMMRGWVSFGLEDGLPLEGIDAMAEDHQGRLWLGSRAGGLGYFDGQNFVLFTTEDGLPSDQVHALATDAKGRVWIGTLQGLLYYDGTDFVVFTTRDGLVDDHVSALLVARDSTIWIGTTQGISRYDGRRFARLKSSDGLTGGEIY
ncbi:MAG: two-component regulator propeller domain-containing protein, partial [Candidatus Latescibacteria bacterium]|nr:two-component regulator propeller domain-containing protein [Candidatus Latescibacterota bacterium]